MNLIAVVVDFRQSRLLLQINGNRFREGLLPRQHDRVFSRRVQVATANLGRPRPRRLQQIRNDAVDLRDLLANLFNDVSGWAGGRQVAPDDFNYTSYTRQRIADFMS